MTRTQAQALSTALSGRSRPRAAIQWYGSRRAVVLNGSECKRWNAPLPVVLLGVSAQVEEPDQLSQQFQGTDIVTCRPGRGLPVRRRIR